MQIAMIIIPPEILAHQRFAATRLMRIVTVIPALIRLAYAMIHTHLSNALPCVTTVNQDIAYLVRFRIVIYSSPADNTINLHRIRVAQFLVLEDHGVVL